MLKLHYTGPKPEISHLGISFKEGKEDKYIYLKTAVALLRAIDQDYTVKESYKIDIREQNDLTDDKMVEILKSYEPELEAKIAEEIALYEKHIAKMIEDVGNNRQLTDEEKAVWVKNIHIMKPYMMQREINKLFYIHTIGAIKKLIYKDNIKEIDINFNLINYHIVRSISANLESGRRSVPVAIKVEPDQNNTLLSKLLINPVTV